MPTALSKFRSLRTAMILLAMFLSPIILAENIKIDLARACDALLSRGVKRAYGLAWPDESTITQPKGGGVIVTYEPPGSIVAAFVLLQAGEQLNKPEYIKAAHSVIQGLLSIQQSTGQIPAHAFFYPTHSGPQNVQQAVADRAATRAALVLAIAYQQLVKDQKDDMPHRLEMTTLGWLLKQQSPTGAWPVGYPPATAPSNAIRLMRIDQGEHRDDVYAMLLSYQNKADARVKSSIERSMQLLARMRLTNASRIGAPLWATAYSLDGLPNHANGALPLGVDILASRYCLQETFAAYLVLGEPPIRAEDARVSYLRMLADANLALAKFPKFENRWRKLYQYDVQATAPPPTTAPMLFDTKLPPVALAEQSGDYDMDAQMAAIGKLRELGREKYLQQLDVNAITRQLSATILGLEDRVPGLPDSAVNDAVFTGGARPGLSEQVKTIYSLIRKIRAADRTQKESEKSSSAMQ